MKRVIFFETWNVSPHLETSLEIAKKHLKAGDHVTFIFMGYDAPYKEMYSQPHLINDPYSPERRGARLLKSKRFTMISRVVIEAIDWDRKLNLSSFSDLKAYQYKDFDVGLAVASHIMSESGDSNPEIGTMKEQIVSMVNSSICVYEFVKKSLTLNPFDLVYVFNGRFLHHRAIMRAAQAAKVNIMFHERGGSDSYFFVRPYVPHDNKQWQQEMLNTWSKIGSTDEAISAAKSFFIEQREMKTRLLPVEQQKGLLPKFPKNRKIVSYFASSDHEIQAVPDVVVWDRWPSQLAALKDLLTLCEKRKDIFLVIRLHPNFVKISARERAEWAMLQIPPNALLVDEYSKVDSYAIVDKSSIVITSSSTVGIEAVYWGKPAIFLGPCGISESPGAVYLPKNKDELGSLLDSTDLVAEPAKVLPYGYFVTSFGQPYKFYKPDTGYSGRFLGRSLQVKPWWLRQWTLKSILKFPFEVIGESIGKLIASQK